MMTNKIVLVLLPCCLLLVGVGCKKRETTRPLMSSSEPGEAKFEACGLITKEEIEAIQGSPISDAKSSESSDGAFRVSQCYYTATESSKSVSLAVTQSSGAGKRSPKDFWKETFGRYTDEEKELKGDKEKKESLRDQGRDKGEEDKPTPPKKIKGIGDDAYWATNRVGGALYILKNNTFIRISVGGADNEEIKLNKSKALAQKAIGRL